MKKMLKNQLVAGLFVASIVTLGLGACSSKSAQTAENTDTSSTVASTSTDKANLGAGSAGRGR